MVIAKVLGNLWATKKDDRLGGYKLLVVQTKNGESTENIVAVDTIGAGIGEDVLIVKGSMTRNILKESDTPIDAAVVGIIDSVEVDEALLK
ncbi:MAG: EutN/CcmL family microcompartment protein [Elusimicrobiota bacterium]|jgi:ethanolamine utilization protein EutN|nr:EutN/CcmL family microcompartment protein [Elusimicrobiota bacterium]